MSKLPTYKTDGNGLAQPQMALVAIDPHNGYVKAMDKDNTCYLFGVTNDENTVAVTISFYIEENDEWKDFDLIYDNQAFYFIGFDENYANRQSSIYGYNEEGGITFQWGGNAMSDGGYIQRDQES